MVNQFDLLILSLVRKEKLISKKQVFARTDRWESKPCRDKVQESLNRLERRGIIDKLYLRPKSKRQAQHTQVFFAVCWINPDLTNWKVME